MHFYIENLGCAKNQVDAEVMINALVEKGWSLETSPETADVIIINTCGFINSAKEESIEVSLGFKKMYPGKKIIMAGCLSQRYGAALKDQLYEIDAFTGNQAPERILEVLDPASAQNNVTAGNRRKHLLSLPGSAYLKIAEGCSNNCTYCSIPIIRGPLKSRTISDIITEITSLHAQGIIEFNLVAQDLGAFGLDSSNGESIEKLFSAFAALPLDFRIRPLYMHPDHFPYKILEIIKNDKRFYPYFDLPFQHASEKILKKMGRKGNSEKYLELIRSIRIALPDAVLRSTFLVGFPGETDEDFAELMRFQHNASIDWVGVFAYSREEQTPAYAFPGRVSIKTALARKKAVEENQIAITEKQLAQFVGREMDILVEEAVKGENLYLGRCYAQAPEVDGLTVIHGKTLVPGHLVRCRIERRNGIDLEAVLCEAE